MRVASRLCNGTSTTKSYAIIISQWSLPCNVHVRDGCVGVLSLETKHSSLQK